MGGAAPARGDRLRRRRRGHTTGEGAGGGWSYVGAVGGASGVYLGAVNGSSWVLAAAHVGAGAFTLDGTS